METNNELFLQKIKNLLVLEKKNISTPNYNELISLIETMELKENSDNEDIKEIIFQLNHKINQLTSLNIILNEAVNQLIENSNFKTAAIYVPTALNNHYINIFRNNPAFKTELLLPDTTDCTEIQETTTFEFSDTNCFEFFEVETDLRFLKPILLVHLQEIKSLIIVGSNKKINLVARDFHLLKSIIVLINKTLPRIISIEYLHSRDYQQIGLFNSVDDFVFITDIEGVILEINEAVTKQLEYPKNQLKNTKIQNLIVAKPENYSRTKIDFQKLYNFHLKTRNGTLIPVEARLTEGKWNNSEVYFCIARDVSERKATEQQLKKLQLFLQQIMNFAKMGGWEYDAIENKLNWTEELYRLHEIDALNTPAPTSIYQFYSEEYQLIIRNKFRKLILYKEDFDIEAPIKTFTGKYIWTRTIVKAHFEDNKMVRAWGMVQDISDYKAVVDMLDAKHKQLDLLVKFQKKLLHQNIEKNDFGTIFEILGQLSNSDFISIYKNYTIDNKLTTAKWLFWNVNNKTLRENKNFTNNRQQINLFDSFEKVNIINSYISELPKNLLFLNEEEDVNTILVVNIFVNNKNFGFFKFDRLKKQKWSDSDISLIKSATSSFTVYQEQLLLEYKFKDFLEFLPQTVFEFNCSKKVIYLNKTGMNLFELTEKELKNGVDISQIMTYDNYEHFISQLNNKTDITSNKSTEYIFKTQTGKTFPGLMYYHFLKNEETNSLIRGIIIDISEQSRAKEELQNAKIAAEAANMAKSEFIANISHELRTPLNIIMGFSQILHEQLEETNPDYLHYLERINLGSKTLLTLIEDILDLSKIEAGRMKLSLEPLNIKSFFKEIEVIFSERIKEKRLQFFVKIHENLPSQILADETRLRQILFNLLSNSIKFTPQGHICIHAFAENVEKEKYNLIIKVEDTGIGIHEKQQNVIFEPFMQQEGQSTRKYGGTGLGLSITKRLVEMMGGKISVESTPEKGSIFTLKFCNINFIEDKTLINKILTNDNPKSISAFDIIEEIISMARSENKINIEILSYLKNDLSDIYTEIKETQTINDIFSFAEELKTIAKNHQLISISKYAEKLEKAAKEFNFDLILQLIPIYEKLLDIFSDK